MDSILPLFKTHYSLGKSILTLSPEDNQPDESDSVFSILKENKMLYDESQFHECMQEQKIRSRSDAEIVLGDWIHVNDLKIEEFVGFDQNNVANSKVIKYRKVQVKGKTNLQVVFNKTPFYPEGGGQVGVRKN